MPGRVLFLDNYCPLSPSTITTPSSPSNHLIRPSGYALVFLSTSIPHPVHSFSIVLPAPATSRCRVIVVVSTAVLCVTQRLQLPVICPLRRSDLCAPDYAKCLLRYISLRNEPPCLISSPAHGVERQGSRDTTCYATQSEWGRGRGGDHTAARYDYKQRI